MNLSLPKRNKVLEIAHWHGNHTVRSYIHLKVVLELAKGRISSLEKRKERLPLSFYKKERLKWGIMLMTTSAKLRARKTLLTNTNLFY